MTKAKLFNYHKKEKRLTMKPHASRFIRLVRANQGSTLEDMAWQLGYTRQSLWDLEQGYKIPSEEDIIAFAEQVKIPPTKALALFIPKKGKDEWIRFLVSELILTAAGGLWSVNDEQS